MKLDDTRAQAPVFPPKTSDASRRAAAGRSADGPPDSLEARTANAHAEANAAEHAKALAAEAQAEAAAAKARAATA